MSAGTPAAASTFAADAAAAGAGALMLLPPLGYRADERELEHHYRSVAEAAGLPLMLYNNPEASGTDMSRRRRSRGWRSGSSALVAVKECSGDVRRIPALLHAGEELEVLVGGDDWALEGFCAGATGWVSGVAVVAPRDCVGALRALPRRGPRRGARDLPPPAAARALRHDPEAGAVLQGGAWTSWASTAGRAGRRGCR